MIFGAELVEGGDLLPVPVGTGDDVFRWSLIEETLHIPLSKLSSMLSGVRLEHIALLLSIHPPEFELQVADGGGAPSHTGQQ